MAESKRVKLCRDDDGAKSRCLYHLLGLVVNKNNNNYNLIPRIFS